ncbi:hypothetical protein HPP92_016880 [Vanilla planifolia]|uniref:Uncharacterized protein n=1 Tax=Vanilla planifolia TaxID=51239 RepID=A0A835QBP5_VANPL|nr:hypothetical protein HPP92_016880 [Vanilla planifolia]
MIFGAAAAFVFRATLFCIQFLRLKLLESVLCLIRFRGIPDLLCGIVVKALTKLFRPSTKLRPNANRNAPVPPTVSATPALPTMPVLEAPSPSKTLVSFMGKHTVPQQNLIPQVPKQKPIDTIAHDPLSLTEKEYRAYCLKQPTSTLTPAIVHGTTADVHAPQRSAAYESSSSMARAGAAHHSPQLWTGLLVPQPVPMRTSPNYIPMLNRLEHVASVEDRLKTQNSTYATNSILSYGARSEHQANSSASLGSMPVSARYSFAGPTISYK